jgi:hypothetical protein
MMIIFMATLFASFIALCGLSHAVEVLLEYFPDSHGIQGFLLVIMVLCAMVSSATAVAGSQLFGLILKVLSKYELNSEGNLQHVENFLVEVVEMVKESVVVLSEDLQVLRCNEASLALFHCTTLLRERVTKFVHAEDLVAFKDAIRQVMHADTNTPVTVEYRVRVPRIVPAQATELVPTFLSKVKKAPSLRRLQSTSWGGSGSSTSKVFPSASSADASMDDGTITPTGARRSSTPGPSADCSFDASVSEADSTGETVQYAWLESTICRGVRFNSGEEPEYDVKMISRNIDSRKKRSQTKYENIVRASEEQARINAAKLRYISCIAHDLKTPLQSFCFSLDLLGQTPMLDEQRELVQQANIAVDLMKLTISQTMDISKALSGGKLQPRRTTVFLSTVIKRVQVIM